MKKLCLRILLFLLAAPLVSRADTQDTIVFRANMSPDNEVPPVSAPGNTGLSTITIRVTRDAAGNINAATVIFDIDYTVPTATTFTGLHIHNALPGTSGGVVINTGISGTNSVSATGSGHITRAVNYASTDTDGLRYVTGLLETPENYYVNIHSTVQPGGLMRAPLLRTSWTFRPQLSPLQEVPPVTNADAEGAAAIQVLVNRNNAGTITSGTVTFDTDYRVPANSIITGLRLENAATGSSGSIAIDTGINATTRAISTPTGRGNIFRIADIGTTNTAGLAVLTSLMSDPTKFYLNLTTVDFAAGIMRGQLATDTYAFYGLMTQAEENPPTGVTATANAMTIMKVVRDTTGNIASGTVSFNVAYSGFDPATTFTGLHIHNGPIGVNAGVVINTGIAGGANSVVTATGTGSVNRDVVIDAPAAGANPSTALVALRGVLQNPEQYYVNIHTTVFGGGAIRAQLVREIYHYRAAMSPANEVPVVNANSSATGWVAVKISRDASGAINGGQVTFDVDAVGPGTATTYTGLHIHTGSAAVAGGVVINTGLSGANPVTSSTGTLNVTRVVNIDPTNAAQMTMLATLINTPDLAYVNIHTTEFGGGIARSQMLPVVNYVPQIAGGGEWISSITITNPSTTSSVNGIVDAFNSNGSAIAAGIVDPNVSFLIPPGGSTTINLHNKGNLAQGYLRVYSRTNVNLTAGYSLFPVFPTTATVTPVSAQTVQIPVSVSSLGQNTGIAIYAATAGQLILTLRDNGIGALIPGGSRVIDVTAGQHVVGFVKTLLPDITQTEFNGRLVIETRPATGTGQMSVVALQFDGTLAPVVVTILQ